MISQFEKPEDSDEKSKKEEDKTENRFTQNAKLIKNKLAITEELKANQKSITDGLEKINETNERLADKGELPRFQASDAPEPLPLPAIEEPEASSSKETETFIYDPSTGFNNEEINYLQSNSLPLPQDLVKTSDYEGVLDDVKILGDKSYRYLYNLGCRKKKTTRFIS